MKRRQFNQTLALMTGALAASAYAGIPASYRLLQSGAARADFSRDQFDARIGSTFRLPDEPQSLVLKGVEDAAFTSQCEQFHLVFELDSGTRLKEGIHTLVGQDGSRMDLFLIPSERGTSRQQMVSCFNLLPAV